MKRIKIFLPGKNSALFLPCSEMHSDTKNIMAFVEMFLSSFLYENLELDG